MKGAVEEVKPWTEKHVNEAKAALYRLAAEEVVTGSQGRANDILGLAFKPESTESASRFLMRLWLIDPNRSEEDRQSILRRVRARAEGREVVEVKTKLFVRFADDYPDEETDDKEYARARCVEYPGARVVRVTLTRRRIVRATKGGS